MQVAKFSVLPGTGETDPQGFERVTLGTTRASAVGIGCQLIVRRRRHAARIARFATRRTGAVTHKPQFDQLTFYYWIRVSPGAECSHSTTPTHTNPF